MAPIVVLQQCPLPKLCGVCVLQALRKIGHVRGVEQIAHAIPFATSFRPSMLSSFKVPSRWPDKDKEYQHVMF